MVSMIFGRPRPKQLKKGTLYLAEVHTLSKSYVNTAALLDHVQPRNHLLPFPPTHGGVWEQDYGLKALYCS